MSDSTRRDINFDNDRRYTRPAAWRKAREAFDGQHDLDRLFDAMAHHAKGGHRILCPRLGLAIALHAYLSADDQQQSNMLIAYFDWVERLKNEQKSRPEQLDREEKKGVDETFEAMMRDWFGTGTSGEL